MAELRERVRRIEGVGGADGRAVVPLGIPDLDAGLPGGGLPLGAVHEVAGAALDAGSATAFAAVLLARLAAGRGPVLWLTRARDLYAPGLAGYGLRPQDLVLVQARPDRAGETDILWAMEEALRCPQVGAVLAEAGKLDLTMSRRLQLAAETGGVPGLLLQLGPQRLEASAAVTRWHVTALPGDGARSALAPAAGSAFAAAAWRAELQRCRGGRPGCWDLVWHGHGGRLYGAASTPDGQGAGDLGHAAPA
ncbi:ImuA family protein [Oleisolibacter albus]|uniref:ImuA family protein n=1 Tax=Oleisolibacter albus TaxID=2171757 RepID=UPI000DF43ECB|nr:hypothetical protein [Oleisolibacter albus]